MRALLRFEEGEIDREVIERFLAEEGRYAGPAAWPGRFEGGFDEFNLDLRFPQDE